jgi:hypothetical protein
MKTKLLAVFIIVILTGCSTADNKSKDKTSDAKIIVEKEYARPIELKDIGPINVIIGNGSRKFFLKNKIDTVTMFAKNLPFANKVIILQNAHIKGFVGDKYIVTPLDKGRSVKIVFKLKRYPEDKVSIPIDSIEIAIKNAAI